MPVIEYIEHDTAPMPLAEPPAEPAPAAPESED